MLKNVLGFHRIRVDDVMVPRADIVAVAADTNLGRPPQPVPHRRPFPAAGLRRDPRRSQGHGPHPGLPRLPRRAGRHPRFARGGGPREDGAPVPPSLGRVDLSMTLAAAKILRPGPVRAALDAGDRPSGAHAGDAHPHGARHRRVRRHRRARLDRGPRRDGRRRHRGRARRRDGAHDRRGRRRHLHRRRPRRASTRSPRASGSTSTTRTAPRTSTRSAASSSPWPAACPRAAS